MDIIEDSELLSLQELAVRHLKAQRQFSLEQKLLVVKAHLQDHVPISRLSKDFGITRVTIWRWIRTFADGKVPKVKSQGNSVVKPNPSVMPKKMQARETEAEELSRLREENKRLSEALKMAEWMNHAKDVMIDEAEKAFNIPIRKKSGAKQ